jgi:hypothetical protein
MLSALRGLFFLVDMLQTLSGLFFVVDMLPGSPLSGHLPFVAFLLVGSIVLVRCCVLSCITVRRFSRYLPVGPLTVTPCR